MPLKWKIFFALNFVLSLPALVCLILLIINLLNRYSSSGDDWIIFLFLLGLLLVAMNGFLNIYLLQRYFPDKLIPAGVKQVTTLSLILNILVSIGVLILCIYAASYEFSSEYEGEERDVRGKIALAVISFLWLVQVVVLVMQGQLPRLISRNNRESMHSLIDSIGK